MKHLIREATIVLPDRVETNWDLIIENGRICELGYQLPSDKDMNISSIHGDILIPGLIDTHVHGAGGYDVMDGTTESLTRLSQALLKEGTTAFLATTLSSHQPQLQAVLETITQSKTHSPLSPQSELLGVHLEGPFLALQYKGAHVADTIPPNIRGNDLAAFHHLVNTYPGLIRILTFAIERMDLKELIACCQQHNIIPAAGHTGADYLAMTDAITKGMCRMTHAFNAMTGIHHREPGPMTAALLNPAVELEFIADGVHVHPAILEMALRLKPQDKITLISDGTRSVGMPNGQYKLGEHITIVQDGIARLTDGTIAGSAYPLLQGLRTVVQVLNRPLYEAVRLTSLNPAQTLNVAHRLGSLECGKDATFVQLTPDLTVKEVWLQGKSVL